MYVDIIIIIIYIYIDKVEKGQPAQWMRQKNEFVLAKFSCPLDLDDAWNVPFCYGINSVLSKMRKKQKKDPAYKNLKTQIEKYEIIDYLDNNDDEKNDHEEQKNMIKGAIKLGRANLKINKRGWLYLHETVFKKILKFVCQLFKNPNVQNCTKVIVVGGFANSKYLVSRLLKEFPDKQFFTPRQPHLAVVKGIYRYIYFVGKCLCIFIQNYIKLSKVHYIGFVKNEN